MRNDYEFKRRAINTQNNELRLTMDEKFCLHFSQEKWDEF